MVTDRRDGAWGLRFPELVGAGQVLVNAPDWLSVGLTIQTNVDGGLVGENLWNEQGMSVPLPAGGDLRVVWPNQVQLRLEGAPTQECMVQPHLSTAAGAVALWRGHQAFHAGAFVTDSGAWGVLGARNAGKSSTLAAAMQRGFAVLTDDLLVVADGAAFAGPRCLDLRSDAAATLQLGIDLGRVGLRERWRVYLGQCGLSVPMCGWVLPQWGDEDWIFPVPPVGRLPALLRQVFLQGITMNNPDRYLELAGLPMLTWQRPRRWSSADHSFDLLMGALTEAAERRTGYGVRS